MILPVQLSIHEIFETVKPANFIFWGFFLQMARSEVVKKMWAIIKERNLQVF